jgi:hypothetical protein
MSEYFCPERSKANKCNSCGENKPCADFTKNRLWLHGHINKCRDCRVVSRKTNKCTDCAAPILEKSKRCYRCSNSSGSDHIWWRGGSFKVGGYVLRQNKMHPYANNKGYVPEHRLVLEEKLGRYLTKQENVHHKNGDRADNRIENLELWNTSQPAGQRPKDKLRYAREIIALYAGTEFDTECA